MKQERNDAILQSIKTNIRASIFVLEYDTAVDFKFLPMYLATVENGRMDFSALVSLKQKDEIDAELIVCLLKVDEGDETKESKMLELSKIPLSPEERKKEFSDGAVSNQRQKKLTKDPYQWNELIKFNYKNVPIEPGYYAIAICAEDEDTMVIIDAQYFGVEDAK